MPVVIHNLPATQLERLLAWLQTQGVLDKLWLTFDDAWTTIKASVPVLEKYKVKAKVFVAPGETLRGNVWTDVAIKAKVPAKVWRGWYALGEPERYKELARWTAGKRIDRSLLDEEGVRLLAKHPLITIENHTWSHLS
ncbi:MAG: polysaccharide deacetylase family protein, partial [Kiritimatiellae bacterium]|nr:polysaccharide deacetylase family protein [Kiritimatiellia bacterium]